MLVTAAFDDDTTVTKDDLLGEVVRETLLDSLRVLDNDLAMDGMLDEDSAERDFPEVDILLEEAFSEDILTEVDLLLGTID